MLPLSVVDDLECSVDKVYQNGKFMVTKEWTTKEGSSVKKNTFVTPYFFDFVYYLKGDLSNSFLVFCDGLENISNIEGINFIGARRISRLSERFGVAYEKYNLNKEIIESFIVTEKNEQETSLVLLEQEKSDIAVENRDIHSLSLPGGDDKNSQRIYYIMCGRNFRPQNEIPDGMYLG